MRFIYCAMICGGLGPDVWDKEIIFESDNFLTAAEFAQGVADEMRGQVVSLEQSERAPNQLIFGRK